MGRKKKSETEISKEPAPKERKVLSGPLRDKSRTMARMVAAVGKVIQKKGYPGLTAPNIAVAAGVDKKLVWTYFGSIDNLIEEYIRQKDFWKFEAKKHIEDLLKNASVIGKKEISLILQSQFEVLQKDKALQKIIHWELGEKNKMLRKVADRREEIGEQLFSVIMPDFETTNVDLRAKLALIVGGIYYLSLHSKSNGSLVCGIDINEDDGRRRIEKAIQDLVFEAYERAGVSK
ncbi:DNA-binding transcriptional regulator, AcrR family [Paenimyroides ummariense]|uniref:DNA-binding transcriptional regulator, AcrR family n=1 Tax=Paenimyroides ummariense TaxID=913024 RepID=A0A1I5EZ04_9FLAO|nr:TetR/AcrR family transcriptional regulator [Paenimyroides ummariense]SFO16697.1 DNA-binding transcriptional regulator, AcrR family [Paenimyroides ummariense]